MSSRPPHILEVALLIRREAAARGDQEPSRKDGSEAFPRHSAPGQELVSETVRRHMVGSDIEFGDEDEHELKGVPGTWRLLTVIDSPHLPPISANDWDLSSNDYEEAADIRPSRQHVSGSGRQPS